MANRAELLQGIQSLIDNHPEGCVFKPGAAERITDRLLPYFVDTNPSKDPYKVRDYEAEAVRDKEFLAVLKLSFELEEIYCPHEPGRRKTWC